MNRPRLLSLFIAMALKEYWQISRDRLTALLLISVPLAQITLFGFAIELTPKNWPGVWVVEPGTTQVLSAEMRAMNEEFQRSVLTMVKEKKWIQFPDKASNAKQANEALISGRASFILHLPTLSSDQISAANPVTIQLESDASDPHVLAASALIAHAANAQLQAMQAEADGAESSNAGKVNKPAQSVQSVQLDLRPRFRMQQSSGAYLVPALVGVILTLTLILLSAFSLVRERERGTWDSLRTTQASAAVIVLGKILPYFVIGTCLFILMQALSHFLFLSPYASWAQWWAVLLFMVCQLSIGAGISLIAQTQMQAMQLGVFIYLPSILLSGFMFPFQAMPQWAKWVGEALPLTHFLRVLRADLFRQADALTLLHLSWPLCAMAIITTGVTIFFYQRRLN